MDEVLDATDELVRLAEKIGLPPAGDQDSSALEFYRAAAAAWAATEQANDAQPVHPPNPATTPTTLLHSTSPERRSHPDHRLPQRPATEQAQKPDTPATHSVGADVP